MPLRSSYSLGRKVETNGESSKDSILAGEAGRTHAIEKEKIEIQSRNRGSTPRATGNRPAAPRARDRRKALEEAQAQKEFKGIADRGIELPQNSRDAWLERR